MSEVYGRPSLRRSWYHRRKGPCFKILFPIATFDFRGGDVNQCSIERRWGIRSREIGNPSRRPNSFHRPTYPDSSHLTTFYKVLVKRSPLFSGLNVVNDERHHCYQDDTGNVRGSPYRHNVLTHLYVCKSWVFGHTRWKSCGDRYYVGDM